MVTKTWVKPESFLQAFAAACQFHHTPVDTDLRARTWAAVRKEIAQNKRYKELWPVATAKLYPEKAPEWASGRLLTFRAREPIDIHTEVVRMMQAEEQHDRCGSA
jgi:hypothetical protein